MELPPGQLISFLWWGNPSSETTSCTHCARKLGIVNVLVSSGVDVVQYWYRSPTSTISLLRNTNLKEISPLLKKPKAVKSFSIKSLSLSSVSWRLLMFCFSSQICSKIQNYYPNLLLNSHIASTHATHPVPNIQLKMDHEVRLGKDIVYHMYKFTKTLLIELTRSESNWWLAEGLFVGA